MDRFYFDANASAPPHPKVVEVVHRAMSEDWANPTSTHREGQRARHRLEEARRTLAEHLGVPPAELIFCCSATEAAHLLLGGMKTALGDRPICVNPGEHSAVLNQLHGWHHVHWAPDVPAHCAMVVQMGANNETGALKAMPQIAGALRIMDAAQMWGKVPLDLSECDAAFLSGHKMGGPRGAAILWMRPMLPFEPVMEGPQERRRRGGTEDLAAILGLAEAAKYVPERVEAHSRLAAMRDAMENEICSWSSDFEVLCHSEERLPNTSALLLRGHSGEAVQMALDLAGFAVSTGSACHSGSVKPSHAVMAMGYSEPEARSVIRISMLPGTPEAHVEALVAALKRILRR
jgi:cysteine desulfurase